MSTELKELAAVMRGAHGLDVSLYDQDFLLRSALKRLEACGLSSLPDYAAALRENRAEADNLYNSLNISYSEFFRDPLAFSLLEQALLPGLLRLAEDREIRVWSAGCAGGQEAYSVAMLLANLCAGRARPPKVRIFATDISGRALASAAAGVYAADALRNVRLEYLERYFRAEGDAYALSDEIKAMVHFSRHDLLDERAACPPPAIYGGFDLVLCGNLLIYYGPEARGRMLAGLRTSLEPGGWLVTGEAERELVAAFGGFSAVFTPAAIFKKTGSDGR